MYPEVIMHTAAIMHAAAVIIHAAVITHAAAITYTTTNTYGTAHLQFETRVENCMELHGIVVLFGTRNHVYSHVIKNTSWVQFYARGIIRYTLLFTLYMHKS